MNNFNDSDSHLFDNDPGTNPQDVPLAARMRPGSLDEFLGQTHILGKGKTLRRLIETDRLSSLIFYGPPGCGKTALAAVIARTTKKCFISLNAVTSSVSDIRQHIARARERRRSGGRGTILFVDEIAHFNRTQQDALMQDIEEGVIVLVGATTQNPFFYVNHPILSRSRVFVFQPLADEDLRRIADRALRDDRRGLGATPVEVDPAAMDLLVRVSEGDARRVLNALETAVACARPDSNGRIRIDLSAMEEALQVKAVRYDRGDDEHYDTISAFIKSMRGSDPDAVLYWLAKMIAAGEDPRFIARRIVICASEDVGNADPMALVVAQAAFGAAETVGMPEARIILAQAALYVATAPKSNASYKGIEAAMAEMESGATQPVPPHLRQGGYRGAERLGRAAGYLYPHDYPGHYVPQEYLAVRKSFYTPSDSGHERRIRAYLQYIERRKKTHEKSPSERVSPEKKTPSGE